MQSVAKKLIVQAYVILFATVLINIMLRPPSLAANHGISYFGLYVNTEAIMAIGFTAACLFFIRASRSIERTNIHTKALVWLLRLTAIFTIIILVTPIYFTNLDRYHTYAGSILFFMQFVFIIWCLITLAIDYLDLLLFLFMLAAGVASAVYVNWPSGYLIQSQLLFQINFMALLLRLLPKINKES